MSPTYSLFYNYWLLLLAVVSVFAVMLWLRYYYPSRKGIHRVRSPRKPEQSQPKEKMVLPTVSEMAASFKEDDQAASLIKVYQELKLANQDIEIFLYKAYHNFLGPIATIRGVCNVAVLEGQENNSSVYFKQVQKVAESMQTMLEKLLQISEIHNHTIEEQSVQLGSFFREYHQHQPHTPESIQAYLHHSELKNVTVYTDTFLLTTIIERIITSAHPFRLPKPNKVAEVFIKYSTNADHDILCLKEFGLELPDHTLDQLFKMFHRSSVKPDDHGLGFYAARYAARRMGGDITVESAAGYINFCIRLPRQTLFKNMLFTNQEDKMSE